MIGTWVPISHAAPKLLLRIATNRHNYATAFQPCERSDGIGLGPGAALPENHSQVRIAEALGNDWRFFTTYVGA